jgi:hypothetical protein
MGNILGVMGRSGWSIRRMFGEGKGSEEIHEIRREGRLYERRQGLLESHEAKFHGDVSLLKRTQMLLQRNVNWSRGISKLILPPMANYGKDISFSLKLLKICSP